MHLRQLPDRYTAPYCSGRAEKCTDRVVCTAVYCSSCPSATRAVLCIHFTLPLSTYNSLFLFYINFTFSLYLQSSLSLSLCNPLFLSLPAILSISLYLQSSLSLSTCNPLFLSLSLCNPLCLSFSLSLQILLFMYSDGRSGTMRFTEGSSLPFCAHNCEVMSH